MKNTKHTQNTLSATLAAVALAVSAGSACDPEPPPAEREERQQQEQEQEEQSTEPAFAIDAIASAEASLGDVPSDLNAYLYWMDDGTGTRGPAIDRVAVGTALPASFSLEIASAPGEDEEYPGLPGVSAATLFVTTEENAELLRDQQLLSLPAGTVFGVSDVIIVHLADDAAAALMLERTGIALAPGFSLVGPDPAAYACLDGAYDAVNACFDAKYAECDAAAFDGENFDDAAWNTCMDGACIDEQTQADEAVALCPPTMRQLPSDTQLDVQMQVVPESEPIADEE